MRLDLRCRELRALYTQGLKEYKVDISKIPKFKSGDNISKQVEDLFTQLLQYPGAAEPYYLIAEELFLDEDL